MENKRLRRVNSNITEDEKQKQLLAALPMRCQFSLLHLNHCILYLTHIDFQAGVCTFEIVRRDKTSSSPLTTSRVKITQHNLFDVLVAEEGIQNVTEKIHPSTNIVLRSTKLKEVFWYGYNSTTYPEDCPLYSASLEEVFQGSYFVRSETKSDNKRTELSPPMTRFNMGF